MHQQELVNIEHKQQLAHDDNNPSCPLCEQNLSASRRRFLKQKFIKEERFITHRINRLSNVVKNLKVLLIDQHNHIKSLTTHAEQHRIATLKQQELEKKHTELTKALKANNEQEKKIENKLHEIKKNIEQATKQLEETKKNGNQTLEKNKEYVTQKQKLEKVETQLRTISYNQEQHNQTRIQLQKIELQLTSYQQDLEQISRQDQRKETIHTLCGILKKCKEDKKSIEHKLTHFADLTQRMQSLAHEEQKLNNQIYETNKKKETLFQEKGRLEQQQLKRKQLEEEQKNYQQHVTKLNETIEDYQTIATATSKDGIQALLIQDIIPEIETEANELLSKLTDNQAQMFIESLRDLKKGGTKETLDIKISDAIGIRPYELFSGGEAFRIDFALRIAISKLLARRAGTSLQTLIIDEGFGSQDEEGLAHIMDAIYKIQDDFAKIIIVSHLPSMKDLFPVHFFIEKGPNGSNITVLQQG